MRRSAVFSTINAMLPIAGPARVAAERVVVPRDSRFRSSETLAAVRTHYVKPGQHTREAKGEFVNAVMILHETAESGRNPCGRKSPKRCSCPAEQSERFADKWPCPA